jgi:uncharacterized protein (TIGR00369 family)
MQSPSEQPAPIIPPIQNHCFGCGPANPQGLQLEFTLIDDKRVVCLTNIPDRFESFSGYLHGGVIATLLDEAMSKAVRSLGVKAMTSQMEIDYLRPVPSLKPIRIEGVLVRSEGRKHWAEAQVLNAKGSVLAKSKGLFVQIRTR